MTSTIVISIPWRIVSGVILVLAPQSCLLESNILQLSSRICYVVESYLRSKVLDVQRYFLNLSINRHSGSPFFCKIFTSATEVRWWGWLITNCVPNLVTSISKKSIDKGGSLVNLLELHLLMRWAIVDTRQCCLLYINSFGLRIHWRIRLGLSFHHIGLSSMISNLREILLPRCLHKRGFRGFLLPFQRCGTRY